MLSVVRQAWKGGPRFAIRSVSTASRNGAALVDDAIATMNSVFDDKKPTVNSETLASLDIPTLPPQPSAETHFSDLPPAEDPLLLYLTNRIMRHGEKQKAQRRVSRIMLHLHAFTRSPPLPLLRRAIEIAAPAVRNISSRNGSKVVIKPVALQEKRRIMYAVKWILEASKHQRGQTIEEKVARELIACLNGDGGALKKKEEVHKTAVQNRGAARA
ncbi:unnamed protein product [Somion occarium]|uniref:Small ribosomal subunit protein uS7 domain-containing protein n=1 Tax=Somion occarium TaxID=3059160 RepID=A0ABP1DLB2_9APHY